MKESTTGRMEKEGCGVARKQETETGGGPTRREGAGRRSSAGETLDIRHNLLLEVSRITRATDI